MDANIFHACSEERERKWQEIVYKKNRTQDVKEDDSASKLLLKVAAPSGEQPWSSNKSSPFLQSVRTWPNWRHNLQLRVDYLARSAKPEHGAAI